MSPARSSTSCTPRSPRANAALRDVEAGPACSVSLRDALVLAWVRGRAVVVQLEDDPRPAAPVPPVDPAVVY